MMITLSSLGMILMAVAGALGLSIGAFGLRQSTRSQRPTTRSVILGQLIPAGSLIVTILVTLVLILLLKGFYTADSGLALVLQHVGTGQPWYYRLSGTWGNHEGSLLLWTWLLAVVSCVWVHCRPAESESGSLMLSIVGLIVLYTLGTANPFEPSGLPTGALLEPSTGLNPLLQDPLLAIHPPILYLGYALCLPCYAIAVSGAWRGCPSDATLAVLKVPALLALAFLTLGITLGSFWAYYELGWGGYWFWDPVENASLLPWLALLCLIHLRRMGSIYGTSSYGVSLAAVTVFVLTILGMFLVRSGIMSSVHSFAADPTRGVGLLGIMTLVGCVGYGMVYSGLTTGPGDHPSSDAHRLTSSYAVASPPQLWLWRVGIATMVLLAITIAWGTLYHLGAQFLGNVFLSVGAPYFEAMALPLVIVGLVSLMLIFQLNAKMAYKVVPAAIGFTVMVVILKADTGTLKTALATGLGAALCSSMLLYAALHRHKALQQAGMIMAHMGCGVLLLGIGLDGSGAQHRVVKLGLKDHTSLATYDVRFEGYRFVEGSNYHAIEVALSLCQGGVCTPVPALTPQWRLYGPQQQSLQETSQTTVQGISHIYAAVDKLTKTHVTLNLWYRPCILLIWIGGGMMALGALMALVRFGRKKKDVG